MIFVREGFGRTDFPDFLAGAGGLGILESDFTFFDFLFGDFFFCEDFFGASLVSNGFIFDMSILRSLSYLLILFDISSASAKSSLDFSFFQKFHIFRRSSISSSRLPYSSIDSEISSSVRGDMRP